MSDTTLISLRIPDTLLRRIDAMSKVEDRSRAKVIITRLWQVVTADERGLKPQQTEKSESLRSEHFDSSASGHEVGVSQSAQASVMLPSGVTLGSAAKSSKYGEKCSHGFMNKSMCRKCKVDHG